MRCEHCEHSCQSCQKETSLTLRQKIVGTIIGIVFMFHIIALRKLTYLKMKKEYMKMMNDPEKREAFMNMLLEQALKGIGGVNQ